MSKAKTLGGVIRYATSRALTKMEEENGLLQEWKGDVLASWITPAIIAAVKRHIAKSEDK